jgi:hypothetical protein
MTVYQSARGRHTAAAVVHLAGSLLAGVLVAHILFVAFSANPANGLVSWVAHWADVVGLWFVGLFGTSDATFTTILNYGAAAVFWLIVTGVLARVLRSAG